MKVKDIPEGAEISKMTASHYYLLTWYEYGSLKEQVVHQNNLSQYVKDMVRLHGKWRKSK